MKENDLCCGCSACIDTCPVNALKMIQSERGFYVPALIHEKCIECKLCEKVCPINNKQWINHKEPLRAYAFQNKCDDVLVNSSSGGVFNLLAKYILNKNGIVYGCAWINKDKAAHVRVDNKEDLINLQKSKYVQSYVDGIFKQIKNDLDLGKLVLFSGTPCQAAGLINFLKKPYDSLFIVDFICHGVPSQKVLAKYVRFLGQKHKREVSNLDFRTKVNGWDKLTVEVNYSDSSNENILASEDPYYKSFLLNLSISKSCANCDYNRLPRHSDITLSDFWGYELNEFDEKLNKGLSGMLCNSEKGIKLFESIKANGAFHEVTINDIQKGNPFINGHCKIHRNSDKFFENLNYIDDADFEILAEKLLKPSLFEVIKEILTYKINSIRK